MSLEDELLEEPNLLIRFEYNKEYSKDVRMYLSDYFNKDEMREMSVDYEVIYSNKKSNHLAIGKAKINDGTYTIKIESEGLKYEHKFTSRQGENYKKLVLCFYIKGSIFKKICHEGQFYLEI